MAEAILGVYVGGTDTRRIKGALSPLLRGAPLSKNAVSHLAARLKQEFETWRERDLSAEDTRSLFMDGWFPRLRPGKQRVDLPTPGFSQTSLAVGIMVSSCSGEPDGP